MSRRNLVLVILILSVASIVPVVLHRSTSGEPRQDAAAARANRQLVGTISCSTSLCHGGTELGKPGSEYTTWFGSDPHARAYDALKSEQSRQIAAALKLRNAAHEEPACLKCHVDPGYANARPNFSREFGVGCESCHGAAEKWLAPHYRATWKTADKQALGMADTKSLHGRAGVCVGCHVGTVGAEVNHDLIAAGHPVLRFEFATYFANLPPHWDVEKDKKANGGAGKDFELRAWSVGQLLSSASALDLLAHRADPANGKAWPEFADLDCYSCHHDLQAKSWRQAKKHLGERRPGTLTLNRWYHAMLPEALSVSITPRLHTAAANFAAASDHPERNRLELAGHARGLAIALRDAAPAQPLAPSVAWPDQFGPLRRADRSWDEATQRYLALLALRAMHKDNGKPLDAELERLIQTLGKEVTFRDFNSPRDFVPAAIRLQLPR